MRDHGGGGAYPGARGSGQASSALQASHSLRAKEGGLGLGLTPHTPLPCLCVLPAKLRACPLPPTMCGLMLPSPQPGHQWG